MKKFNKYFYVLLIFIPVALFASLPANAQDDLLKILEEEEETENRLVYGTFKGTRLINGHAMETRGKGILEFIISHRFGKVNSGVKNFFGLDDSNIRLGLDYSVTDRFTIGLGRSSYQKVYDGFLKFKLLAQRDGGKMPFTAVLYSNMSINSLDWSNPGRDYLPSDRYTYTHQLLIARKLNEETSVQLMPTLVHRNLASDIEEDNQIYALGVGGKQKITNRVALTFEYYHQFNNNSPVGYENSVAVGFDIETGGHVFQLHFTNSRPIFERGFITETTGNFFKGDIHFGFNITRAFQLGRKKPG
jgi:hypothetical protein